MVFASYRFAKGHLVTAAVEPGTCEDHTPPSRIGWFITYADDAHAKIAFVVLLRGNTRSVKGPTAAVVAGRIYRKLREQNYFADSGHAVAINKGN